jgi:hypothetical protein
LTREEEGCEGDDKCSCDSGHEAIPKWELGCWAGCCIGEEEAAERTIWKKAIPRRYNVDAALIAHNAFGAAMTELDRRCQFMKSILDKFSM